MAMTFNQLLDKYRKISFSERDKGERFERLMQAYLKTDPKYADRFKKVWMWNEFPYRKDLGGSDTGIDLVAQTVEGDYWAIQCKCYQESAVINKPEVDSFLSSSSRQFKDENFQTTGFTNRLWISTTNKWNRNAEQAIANQNPPVSRINLFVLRDAPVDWEKIEQGISGVEARTEAKTLRDHQVKAVQAAHDYYQEAERGKMIMACGTGKTYTSLKIAENETGGSGLVLFLVPSIALLGQTLNEWTADAQEPIKPICICSDARVSRKTKKGDDSDEISVLDLALPATTDTKKIVKQLRQMRSSDSSGLTVVFSTYQSIDVIATAQKVYMSELGQDKSNAIFDMVICDEAHRTTGVAITADDQSSFIKVHDDDFLKAKKRLYMTATPRIYSDDAQSKAAESDAILCSMDDESLYGKEFYRIGFGEAVSNDLLTDYKVLILTLTENDVSAPVQNMVADKDKEINIEDAAKLIGCINALSKQVIGDEGTIKGTDPMPMKRAVAFCQKIADSKTISHNFNETSDIYLDSLSEEKKEAMVSPRARHVDGTMSAPERDELLSWLKGSEDDSSDCRILTNVRCLSEGVDVPSLDAVLFLSARNSHVDVVQSVGRVMRKAENKRYGYIIIPVLVPSDVEPDKALDNNDRYKVVWSVLNALRSHDDRFDATINKIELNKKRPGAISVVGVGDKSSDTDSDGKAKDTPSGFQMTFQFEHLQQVVYARLVQKVGNRRFWEQWAKDVGQVAERQIERLKRLISTEGEHKQAFIDFLKGLQSNINPSVTESEALEMLSQHIITKPVFEALFEGYSFVEQNPISLSMQSMLDLLEKQALEKEAKTLDKFYESVRMRVKDIDNAEARQKIIVELYDKFFKTAFPKMVEKLGIVYTPVEVVDFIIHSVNDILKQEFGRTLSDENVHILDPFTGTGTFITRLLQSGLIDQKDLSRKYHGEIHANEIVLLAYYIAAVNIENTYHDLMSADDYETFEGICLTDTFQLGENGNEGKLISEVFPQNSERVERQRKAPVRVIIGNPPYSIGQKSANDNAQNQKYEKLDSRLAETYVAESSAVLDKALYDAYIRAFRWSTDRLDENGGIIAFVSNGSWIDGNSTSGFRKSIEKEFSSIYVFNLRGNQRTSGEVSRKEGGKIFGGGSRTPISITLLIKNPSATNERAKIYYRDIGDYLSRKEKLEIVSGLKTVANPEMRLKLLDPNEHGDWINQRNDAFDSFIPMAPEKKFDFKSDSVFIALSLGTVTARDFWVYNYSMNNLKKNINKTINYYNRERELVAKGFQESYNADSLLGSWSRDWQNNLKKNKPIIEFNEEYRITIYRPYVKVNSYFDDDLNQERYQLSKLFPTIESENLVICVHGQGGSKDFSTVISNMIVDFNSLEAGAQCFPLYYYEERKQEDLSLFDEDNSSKYIRRDGVSDFILNRARKQYGKRVTKEDIFYYVYGILHSPDYRQTFSNDLKKMLPRIPLVDVVQDFWQFSRAGKALAELHIKYESIPPYEGVTVSGDESENFYVTKNAVCEGR